MSRRSGSRAGAAAAGAVLCVVLGLGSGGAAVAAGWQAVPETGAPGGLVLEASPYPLHAPDLRPGRPAFWQVHTRVDRAGPISTEVALRREGALVEHPDGLRVTVSACERPWRGLDTVPVCDDGQRVLSIGPGESDSLRVPVSDPDGDGSTWLLVELAIADTTGASVDDGLMGLEASVGLGVTASAEDPVAGSSSTDGRDAGRPGRSTVTTSSASLTSLAFTGAAFVAPLFVAAALVLVGVAVRLRRTAASGDGGTR
ncbi:hypothetical protein [Curtobacterium oceanosedimentum]|uniref:Uncharacterized protein n=1 Tax=Curtobacterium oceanosedimentum TaxID=465820 RepID=A0A147DSC3_9MICO|nr:hypothetical protein [Curtobacterium oceanosedimentum]KTR52829.1 hypothetical protein NS359_04925 [Curtobacterium oceanosedimentum]